MRKVPQPPTAGFCLDAQQHTAIVLAPAVHAMQQGFSSRHASPLSMLPRGLRDDHIYIGGHTVLGIVKADKFHMYGQARQCLVDVDQRMQGFVEMPRQPGGRAPTGRTATVSGRVATGPRVQRLDGANSSEIAAI